jgi:hypothetical protein
MTHLSINTPARPWWQAVVDFLATLGQASDLGRRAAAAERLYALSDAELARLGLTRERILHHVFGPYLHV